MQNGPFGQNGFDGGNFDASEPPVITLNPMGMFLAASMVGALSGVGMMALWASAMRNAATAMAGAGSSLTVNFPFANGFTQVIDPSTNWGVIGNAGDAPAERAILERAGSYGRQLGRLMDVVRDLAAHDTSLDPKKRKALEALAKEIDEIKAEYGLDGADSAK